MKYERHLDGLRAVSILLVICNHFPGAPFFINGSVGVDIFFAISGFLITNILLTELHESGDISLRAFYTKRAFRILPLYFVTIAMYILVIVCIYRFTGDRGKLDDLYAALPYLVSMNEEFMSDSKNTVFGQAWSLGIEEKFYLFWPLLLLFFSKKRNIGSYIIVAAIFVITIYFVPNGLVERGHARAYLELVFASLLTIIIWRYKAMASRVFAGNSAYFLLGAVLIYYILKFGVIMNVSVSIFSTLIIVSLHISPKQRLADLLSFKPLVFIGKLSYGIYLVHVLVIHIVFVALEKLSVPLSLPWSLGFLIVLTVSVAVAYLLRITIERPMIAYGRSLAKLRPLVKPPEIDGDDGARAPSKTRLST